jgi:hypothetical protein
MADTARDVMTGGAERIKKSRTVPELARPLAALRDRHERCRLCGEPLRAWEDVPSPHGLRVCVDCARSEPRAQAAC